MTTRFPKAVSNAIRLTQIPIRKEINVEDDEGGEKNESVTLMLTDIVRLKRTNEAGNIGSSASSTILEKKREKNLLLLLVVVVSPSIIVQREILLCKIVLIIDRLTNQSFY